MTSSQRGPASDLLPNLLIAGVAKCGTTSLFAVLGEHPSVCPSDVKELNHFSPLAENGAAPTLQDYARHFRHWRGERYRLEASPRYARLGDVVIAGIQDALPQPRVIISVRDPVARFWSAYRYLVSRGRLPRDMTCAAYLRDCERQRETKATALTVGMYGDYLPAWAEAFGGRLRVVFAEQLAGDQRTVVAALCQWLDLDVDPLAEAEIGRRNTTYAARSHTLARAAEAVRPLTRRVLRTSPRVRVALRQAYTRVNATTTSDRLDESTAERLRALYASSNARTAALLRTHGERSLPSWLAEA